ncbi:M81 family metallopeptidase [Paraburkholderia sp. RP-4-7]|uniref:Microcystinase C n=1 Tax=Paraburkholderia polaris TaxID=2728848 RepID=A0A848ID31_9BURK|nr:M81 family metallopeptidase [Paraburkholderia polaris]NML99082.1 M81 family metallopeptidase [Paraburkholderia polaris]
MHNATAPLRFVVGGICHETNTYATEFTGYTPLSNFKCLIGDEVEAEYAGANHTVGGYIEGAAAAGVELVYSTVAMAWPSGTIRASAYEHLKQSVLDGIRNALPVDGVLMTPHGAGVVEGIDDLEGDLLAAVRELVGADVPIASVYDLHGQMTEQMRDHSDLTLPCRLYPHTDLGQRGVEAVELLAQTVRGAIRPVTAMHQLPMLGMVMSTEPGLPTAHVNDLCMRMSERPGVIDCSWFHGFPYADIPAPCPAVVCTTDGDLDLAQRCADEVADWIWANREAFRPRIVAPDEGVTQALAVESGLVVINENSDNPGGGAPGDATHLLRALLDAHLPPETACFVAMHDPDVAQKAQRAGVGATIEVKLGGKLGKMQGAPIVAEAYVKAVTDGRFTNLPGSMLEGVQFDLGTSCRLIIEGVDVIVISRPTQTFDHAMLLLHGIDVHTRKIVALKSSNHFRAGFQSIASAIITVDSPGLSSADVASFPRSRLAQHIWPLHDDVVRVRCEQVAHATQDV